MCLKVISELIDKASAKSYDLLSLKPDVKLFNQVFSQLEQYLETLGELSENENDGKETQISVVGIAAENISLLKTWLQHKIIPANILLRLFDTNKKENPFLMIKLYKETKSVKNKNEKIVKYLQKVMEKTVDLIKIFTEKISYRHLKTGIQTLTNKILVDFCKDILDDLSSNRSVLFTDKIMIKLSDLFTVILNQLSERKCNPNWHEISLKICKRYRFGDSVAINLLSALSLTVTKALKEENRDKIIVKKLYKIVEKVLASEKSISVRFVKPLCSLLMSLSKIEPQNKQIDIQNFVEYLLQILFGGSEFCEDGIALKTEDKTVVNFVAFLLLYHRPLRKRMVFKIEDISRAILDKLPLNNLCFESSVKLARSMQIAGLMGDVENEKTAVFLEKNAEKLLELFKSTPKNLEKDTKLETMLQTTFIMKELHQSTVSEDGTLASARSIFEENVKNIFMEICFALETKLRLPRWSQVDEMLANTKGIDILADYKEKRREMMRESESAVKMLQVARNCLVLARPLMQNRSGEKDAKKFKPVSDAFGDINLREEDLCYLEALSALLKIELIMDENCVGVVMKAARDAKSSMEIKIIPAEIKNKAKSCMERLETILKANEQSLIREIY